MYLEIVNAISISVRLTISTMYLETRNAKIRGKENPQKYEKTEDMDLLEESGRRIADMEPQAFNLHKLKN